MSDQYKWEYYRYKRYMTILKNKLLHSDISSYAGRKLLTLEQGNLCILNMLEGNAPFVVARFGSVELSAIVNREADTIGKNARNTDADLCNNAGFFPNNKEMIDGFAKEMLDNIKHIDALGVWNNPWEEYIVDKYMPDTQVMPLAAIEPYIFDKPWSTALAGKKVLIIHPFEESILQQYKRRDLLFKNRNVLPDFEINTIKAVQTQAGERDERFRNWFDALYYMEEEMDRMDFDVAIIGCGAYGMPLAVHAKQMGKQAIHMGGATQILFGIKGKRWDDNPLISRLYNEYWIRPNSKEIIKGKDLIENGCYW